MLTLIGKVNRTDLVDRSSIEIERVAGDPHSTAKLRLVDPDSSIILKPLDEVIFIDENAIYPGASSPMVPAHNYLTNNNFNYGDANWPCGGSLASAFSFPPSGTFGPSAVCSISVVNAAVGVGAAIQIVGESYMVPGQQYCFSGMLSIESSMENASTQLVIQFMDVNGQVIDLVASGSYSSATSGLRVCVTGAAPASTNSAQAQIRITTTDAINSGSATWTAMQFEPVWFPDLYSYPTPICDFLQADCITLPDGTTSRFNRIFTGFLTQRRIGYEGNTRIFDLTATSAEMLLETMRLVSGIYHSRFDQDIIAEIINGISPRILYASLPDFALGTPAALAWRNLPVVTRGVMVSDLHFSDATPREILNALADLSDYVYGVDPYFNLWYHHPFFQAAPYALSSAPDGISSFAYHDYTIDYDDSQIQNALSIIGGTYQQSFTESWNAQDGSHAENVSGGQTVNANLWHRPINVPTVIVDGVTLNCQIDTGQGWTSGVTALCNKEWPYVAFLNPVPAGTPISISYLYDARVYTSVQSSDSIATHGRILYGKIEDTNLISNSQAVSRGETHLRTNAFSRVTVQAKTLKPFAPGQVVSFTSDLDGITQQRFLIQKVTARQIGAGMNEYDLQMGIYQDNLVDLFRNTQKALGRSQHDINDPILEYANQMTEMVSVVAESLSFRIDPGGGGNGPGGNPVTFTPTLIALSQPLENALVGAQYYGSGAPPPGYPLSDRSKRFSWNVIEPSQGNYDFTIIDNGLAAAAAAGYKFGWRIMPINGGMNVPSYIPGTWSNGVYVPDWNSSAFLTAAQNLMNALAARYANDPRVGLLDMSLYGCWGEWNESCFSPSLAASASTRQQLIDMQYAAFPNKRFVMLTNWQDSLNYALNATRNKPTGVRIDCLGTTSLGGAKNNLDNNPLELNRWQTAPLYFEYCANADFALGDSQVKQYCASIVGDGDGNVGDWSSYSSTQQQNLLNSYIHSGYRYWLASLTTVDIWTRGQGVQVSAVWQNLNRAPVYDQFDIFYQLRVGASVEYEWQSSYDLRTLYSISAGAQHTHTETLSVPTGLSAGTYTLAVIVRDHEGYYPAMHLSQQGRQSDGAYTLGTIIVV